MKTKKYKKKSLYDLLKYQLSKYPYIIRNLKTIQVFLRQIMQPSSRKNTIFFQKFLAGLSKYNRELTFIKVGANDGVTGDPCSNIFLSDPTWRGILVEPVPYLFEKLCNNFCDNSRFTFCNFAISNANGNLPFYFVDPTAKDKYPEVSEWYHQLGSFDKNHIIENSDAKLKPFIIEVQVPAKTLDDIVKDFKLTRIDFLQIDVEGHDFDVLFSLNFNKTKPLSIFVEHKHIDQKQKQLMLKRLKIAGYKVWDCGCDLFCINSKGYKLLKKLSLESN
jgi:FkbM family methyltransferase